MYSSYTKWDISLEYGDVFVNTFWQILDLSEQKCLGTYVMRNQSGNEIQHCGRMIGAQHGSFTSKLLCDI